MPEAAARPHVRSCGTMESVMRNFPVVTAFLPGTDQEG